MSGALVAAVLADPARAETLSADRWNALIAAARAEQLIGSVATRLDGIAMPPARFDATVFAALRRATGDRGARPLLAQARLFPLPAAVLRDIDRQEDLDA